MNLTNINIYCRPDQEIISAAGSKRSMFKINKQQQQFGKFLTQYRSLCFLKVTCRKIQITCTIMNTAVKTVYHTAQRN